MSGYFQDSSEESGIDPKWRLPPQESRLPQGPAIPEEEECYECGAWAPFIDERWGRLEYDCPNCGPFDVESPEQDMRSVDDEDYPIDGVGFADPGGRSALRAETPDNPRIYDCPNCDAKGVLTAADMAAGYQCDRCADAAEGFGY